MTKTIPGRFVLNRTPQDDEELWWIVQALWGVKIPRTQMCPDHSTPFQAFADAYFARHPVTVWKASRGFGGKSYLLATLALTEGTMLGAQISLLGGSGAQSLNVHNHTKALWSWMNAPRALIEGDPTKFDTFFANKGHIRSLMASQGSVRGPHPQRLLLDEIDEMDMDILRAAQGQPMRARGIETQTVMSSTHQYPDGTMSAILNEAQDRGWPIYHWCYRETSNPTDGWLTEDEVERKRNEIPVSMWETEYDLQEPSFGGRSIDTESVDACFNPMLGEYSGEDPVKMEEPKGGVSYVTGIDWAKQRDMTIVATFKREPSKWYCVAWRKYNRLPWPVMVQKAVKQWLDYGGELVHDATGIGNVVDDIIRDTVPQALHRHVRPYVMGGGQKRAELFSEYIAAIERREIAYPRIRYAYDEHRYCTDDALYKASGHPPDSMVAGALAWTRKKRAVTFVAPQGTTKEAAWRL